MKHDMSGRVSSRGGRAITERRVSASGKRLHHTALSESRMGRPLVFSAVAPGMDPDAMFALTHTSAGIRGEPGAKLETSGRGSSYAPYLSAERPRRLAYGTVARFGIAAARGLASRNHKSALKANGPGLLSNSGRPLVSFFSLKG